VTWYGLTWVVSRLEGLEEYRVSKDGLQYTLIGGQGHGTARHSMAWTAQAFDGLDDTSLDFFWFWIYE